MAQLKVVILCKGVQSKVVPGVVCLGKGDSATFKAVAGDVSLRFYDPITISRRKIVRSRMSPKLRRALREKRRALFNFRLTKRRPLTIAYKGGIRPGQYFYDAICDGSYYAEGGSSPSIIIEDP